jgi:hypothetical protein
MDETTTKVMCRWGDNNRMYIKKMEYVKKEEFYLSVVREYLKALRIYFSRNTVLR